MHNDMKIVKKRLHERTTTNKHPIKLCTGHKLCHRIYMHNEARKKSNATLLMEENERCIFVEFGKTS